jgi:hypothetical protein
MAFNPRQPSRFQGDKGTATLIRALQANSPSENIADRHRPAAHLLVGADAERQRQRSRMRLLAGTDPIKLDRP